jgi:hypothetical protein
MRIEEQAENKKKRILLVDFDGVINSYTSGWQASDIISDPPVEGALAFLWEVSKQFDVCIYSARSPKPGGIDAMKKWLAKWNEVYWKGLDLETDSTPDILDVLRFPLHKLPAFLTLDDRCIQFTGVFPSSENLAAFKTWQYKEK